MTTRPDRKSKPELSPSRPTLNLVLRSRMISRAMIGLSALAGFAGVILLTTRQPSRETSPAETETTAIAQTAPPATVAAPSLAIATKPVQTPEPPPPGPAPEGMVWIPTGSYWMDRTEVTNKQFGRFVHETGYVTTAEKKPDPKDFPGAPPELLVPGSIVFTPPAGRVSFDNPLVWWRYVPGANWKHPEGPESSITDKENHPVVQVSWDDAVAYAQWAKKRLPTEAEWEYAARGGKVRNRYVWGDQLKPDGQWRANIWQGSFPDTNTAQDGFTRLAPVGTFPPNGFGLLDMAGNAWEWCSDWYQPGYGQATPTINPTGPLDSHDPQEPGVPKRVQRGGSFLCSDEYCTRYLPGSRGKGEPSSGASHLGFRCVLSVR